MLGIQYQKYKIPKNGVILLHVAEPTRILQIGGPCHGQHHQFLLKVKPNLQYINII